MKTSQMILLSILLLAGSTLAAKYESPIADTMAVERIQDPGNYDVSLEHSQAINSTTWRYTITKSTNRTKDLGHFIVNFANCDGQSPTIANIVSATVNGVDWLDQIEASE